MAIQIQLFVFYRFVVCFWRQHLQTIPNTFRLLHRNWSLVVSSTCGSLLTWSEVICLLCSFAVESCRGTQNMKALLCFQIQKFFVKEKKLLKKFWSLRYLLLVAIYAWRNISDLELNNSSLHENFPNCSIYRIMKNDPL